MPQYHSVESEGLLLITLFFEDKPILQLLVKNLSLLRTGEIKWLRVADGVNRDMLEKLEFSKVLKDQGLNEVVFETLWINKGVFMGDVPDKSVFEALGFDVVMKKYSSSDLLEEKVRALNISKDFASVDSYYFKAVLKTY